MSSAWSAWMQHMFCNCCATGCDCGCAEECGLMGHRPVPVDPVTPASPSEQPMGGQSISASDALEEED